MAASSSATLHPATAFTACLRRSNSHRRRCCQVLGKVMIFRVDSDRVELHSAVVAGRVLATPNFEHSANDRGGRDEPGHDTHKRGSTSAGSTLKVHDDLAEHLPGFEA